MGDRKKPSPHSGAKLERIIAARAHHKTREQRRAEVIAATPPVLRAPIRRPVTP